MTYREAVDGELAARDLATLLFPFYGVTDAPPHRFLADRLAYVGWILTAFAPFAFFRRDRLRIVVFLGLSSRVWPRSHLETRSGLFRLQHALFPGLRVPGRVSFMATFSLALLGGLGLEAFLRSHGTVRGVVLAVPALGRCPWRGCGD